MNFDSDYINEFRNFYYKKIIQTNKYKMKTTALVPHASNTKDCSRWQFNNKYLDAEELQKPSSDVAEATKRHTEMQLRNLVQDKTMVS